MKIYIRNIKAVVDAVIDTSAPITVIIGEQASGKSTIAKIVYIATVFHLQLSYYLYSFFKGDRRKEPSLDDFLVEYAYYVATRLPDVTAGEFAVFYHGANAYQLRYVFSKNAVKVQPSDELRSEIEKYLATNKPSRLISDDPFFDAAGIFIKQISLEENALHSLYVPAGRGPLIPLSNQLQGTRFHFSDEFASSYIRWTVRQKRLFAKEAKQLSKWAASKNNGKRRVVELVRSILKGSYTQDINGEEFLNLTEKDVSVELQNASSGQQEIIYPLFAILEQIIFPSASPSLIIFEEPEAHLHPESQKAVMDLLAYAVNNSKARFFITTHSPYVLTSLAPLLLSGRYEKKGTRKPIIPFDFRLSPGSVAAYSLTANPFSIKSIIGEEGTIDPTDIDRVSELIENQIYKLFAKGAKE
ncbi:MAG: AAA family ATPase [Bacilli bacterium]|nr:AAA family ATPase [Bacilli bacterium]